MVTVLSLWLPILLSAIAVFVLSSLIHMVLGYHNSDFKQVPQEDAVMDALRPFNLPPGEYLMPRASGGAEMKSPEFQAKWKRGPVALLNVFPNETFGMGRQLGGWFVYCLVMSSLAAYIASRAVPAGGDYLAVSASPARRRSTRIQLRSGSRPSGIVIR